MKTENMTTTDKTKKKAENLSGFLFGEITSSCKWNINKGEDSTKWWIKRIEENYNVIAM